MAELQPLKLIFNSHHASRSAVTAEHSYFDWLSEVKNEMSADDSKQLNFFDRYFKTKIFADWDTNNIITTIITSNVCALTWPQH